MLFNGLHEPWRAFPESWHLSRIYYIPSIITFTQVENISWELALKPGYHNTIPIYIINSHPGNNCLCQKALSPWVCLTRGKHPLRPKGTLARGLSRPGKAPTSGLPEVLRPRGTQGFGNLPEDQPGLGGNSLHDYGVFSVHQRGPISLMPR